CSTGSDRETAPTISPGSRCSTSTSSTGSRSSKANRGSVSAPTTRSTGSRHPKFRPTSSRRRSAASTTRTDARSGCRSDSIARLGRTAKPHLPFPQVRDARPRHRAQVHVHQRQTVDRSPRLQRAQPVHAIRSSGQPLLAGVRQLLQLVRTPDPAAGQIRSLNWVGPRNRTYHFPRFAMLDLDIEHRFTFIKGKPWIGLRAYNALNRFTPSEVQANLFSPAFGSFYNSYGRQIRLQVRFDR